MAAPVTSGKLLPSFPVAFALLPVIFPRMVNDMESRTEIVLLDPAATAEQIRRFCQAALEEGRHGVCLPSSRIEQAYEFIGDNSLKLSCLVGYPLGSSDSDVKRFETEVAADLGAHEIDLYLHTGLLLERAYNRVLREIRDVVDAADERPVKVSVDLARFSESDTEQVLQMILDSGAHYICPALRPDHSTGLQTILRKTRQLVGPKFGLKAPAFGSSSASDLDNLVLAGADRVALFR